MLSGVRWFGAGALLASLVWAQACAGAPGEGGGAGAPGFPQAADRCVLRASISSWRPIDSRRLKLFADREYVVELMTRCSSLPLTEQVEFLSRDQQICDYRADRIRTDRETCSIGSIRTVEEVEEAEAARQQP